MVSMRRHRDSRPRSQRNAASAGGDALGPGNDARERLTAVATTTAN